MLTDAGIPCGIFLAPIMPRITDSEDALRAIFEGAKAAGASFCWSSPLRLVPPVRDHYFETIERNYPELLDRYQQNYRTPDSPHAYRAFVHERVDRLRREYDLPGEGSRPAAAPSPIQLRLIA
jgi:DNA repair photolyase